MGVSNITSLPSPGLKSKQQSKILAARSKPRNAKVVLATATKRNRRPPVVTFNDKVDVEKFEKVDMECKPFLWWTRDERRDIAERNRKLAADFRDIHSDKVEDCNDVYDRVCCNDDYDDDDEEDDDEDDLFDTSYEYLQYSKAEVPALVRGLEWGFLPSSKSYRRVHLEKVLQAQTLVQSVSNEDTKAKMLSTRAIKSSRPSREMARILGQCDEEATKKKSLLGRNRRCRMIPSWW